jgi:hypothetical protein
MQTKVTLHTTSHPIKCYDKIFKTKSVGMDVGDGTLIYCG